MRLFLQYASSGVATGCAFALVATGFVAIYRVTRVVNFAQGVFAVLAGMLAAMWVARGTKWGPTYRRLALGALVALATLEDELDVPEHQTCTGIFRSGAVCDAFVP